MNYNYNRIWTINELLNFYQGKSSLIYYTSTGIISYTDNSVGVLDDLKSYLKVQIRKEKLNKIL